MFLGIDDTDSPDGMCTTYLGAMLAENLRRAGYTVGEMRLIRLNPNVVWKTRGNAAVCLEVTGGTPEAVFDAACGLVEEFAEFDCENTNPGVVVVKERPDPAFYYQALQRFCTIGETVRRLDKIGALYCGYKCGRGLIGALAAVSSVLPDATYELLAYRSPERFGTPREIVEESFFASAAATFPHTWDTVDPAAGTVVCVPHGKDPVLYGIRGESPEWVEASAALLLSEPPTFSQIWKTNQGTDAHLLDYDGEPLEGLSYRIDGVVIAEPLTRCGGHVQFLFMPDTGGPAIIVFAFEPTKEFRHMVRRLLSGDRITLCGSWRKNALHLEKFRANTLVTTEVRESPKCPVCGGRMTSAGYGKGYKCRNCSGRIRDVAVQMREITEGWYEVPPDARRHLAKPIARMQDD
ncbi:tRNA(Ile)(2)-agmatinylcytidine synthase [Methanocorpusculum sp. MG]|uniref:tRNA(Ile2) 2-agmatinylcytidine synthetase TiaS n=1 Tax=Methanocorpusculum petauri TaxID=3002863 RepID=A0ABT4IG94_9EURY|nr:tRNA(Ile)(2)-agmatinylcytidine synthase [Methanocorpusculum petauri]MCZ0860277.1 tRNA(Ile)(2)-agmatinylcytidine synthase [Methanocorpusculum petauri]